MRSRRQTEVRRALLQVLSWMPEGCLLEDRTLQADAARLITPNATTVELIQEIREADTARLIAGLPGEVDVERKITQAGRLWLAEHA